MAVNRYANDFTSTVRAYYKELAKFKPMLRSREKKLLRLAKGGDASATREIMEAHLKFVFDIARRYKGMGIPMGELISDGNLGLAKAIDRYDESRGVKFITYAVWWIRESITADIKKHRRRSEHEVVEDFSKMSINEALVSSMQDSSYDTDSLEEKAVIMKRQDESVTELLAVLSPREKEVIEMLYGISNDNEMSLFEIGDRLGITSERVRQIKTTAIRKMRSTALANGIESCTIGYL